MDEVKEEPGSTGPLIPPVPAPLEELSVRERIRQRNNERYTIERERANPGTNAADYVFERDNQEDILELSGRGFRNTAGYGIGRAVHDWYRSEDDPNYKRGEHYDELTRGLPYEYHDDVMSAGSLEDARRVRRRIEQDLMNNRVLSANGGTGFAGMMIGGLLDIDLPLTLLTDGAWMSAKAARAINAARRIRGIGDNADALGNVASLGVSGLLAGTAVGVGDALSRETVDWTDVPNAALSGAAVAALAPFMRSRASATALRQRAEADRAAFEERLRGDPNLGLLPHYDMPETHPNTRQDAFEPVEEAAEELEPEGSMGAARNPDRPILEDVSVPQEDRIAAARNWREDTGWLDAKKSEEGQWFTRVMQGLDKIGLAGDYQKLYDTKSAVGNWMAGALFESPAGLARGRVTAAGRMEAYNSRIMSKFSDPYIENMKIWAKDQGKAQLNGLHVSDDAAYQFGREVHLELNKRRVYGEETENLNPQVRNAVDAIEAAAEEAYNIGKGRDGELPVDGFQRIEYKRGYTPLMWQGQVMRDLIKAKKANKQKITRGIADGYIKAGIKKQDAMAIAKAVVTRALKRDEGVDMSLYSMLTSDGREFMRETLMNDGMPQAKVDRLIKSLTGSLEERGKEGFTKGRNEIDLNTPIPGLEGVRIVDLVNNDMVANWSRYSRRMAGSSALARAGVQNRAARKEVRDAIVAEQRALGEDPLDPAFIDDLFTHFDGGPVGGGVSPWVMRAKRMTNLALLNKLGLTQAGETGAVIAAVGWENFLAHSKGMRDVLDKIKAEGEIVAGKVQKGDKTVYSATAKKGANPTGLLDELKVFLGDIGMDHQHFRDDLALDMTRMTRNEKSEMFSMLDKALAKGTRVQGFISGFYEVRKWQQRLAVTAMTDKVLRTLKKGANEQELARLKDIGIDAKSAKYLKSKIDDGTVEFSEDGYVNRLNLDKWDWEEAENFSMSLHRHQNQTVQKAMAGEDNMWMHKDVGALLTHLKSFPLLAMSKQAVRHARHRDPTAIATLFAGLGTAGLVYIIRQAADGRTDRLDPVSVMQGAFGMSNMTGWVPMMTDPVATMFGLEDYRFNQYGPHAQVQLPTLDTMNNLIRAPGAMADKLRGTDDYYDTQALRALPFANWYGISAITNRMGE